MRERESARNERKKRERATYRGRSQGRSDPCSLHHTNTSLSVSTTQRTTPENKQNNNAHTTTTTHTEVSEARVQRAHHMRKFGRLVDQRLEGPVDRGAANFALHRLTLGQLTCRLGLTRLLLFTQM